MTLSEIQNDRFFGIPGSLFFKPQPTDPFRIERYGSILETPIGVAAGPHTQLAINIIAAWLCGARYLELKTIQSLDELEVSKPCIDMQDEGYNCEWSQELKIHESFREYLNAWIVIHILRRELKFEGPVGTLFNMSVGYNYEGILKENVQWFFRKMGDCSEELEIARKSVRDIYPEIDNISIPVCISDHITLSTMHGCPPEEIEKIGMYLIKEKKYHTTIKLNPTLLGKEKLKDILVNRLGFKTEVPDIAFEHDLKYPEAVGMISKLQEASIENNLQFAIKLTNTLESRNNKSVFSENEAMMYMSGRALHPISINLALKLQAEFKGYLDVSFSAGVDCFNIADVLACGLKPATVCTDLLKPGGYGRLWQYIFNLRSAFDQNQALTLDDHILNRSGNELQTVKSAALQNLRAYAEEVLSSPAYCKSTVTDPSIKTTRSLGFFDCIHAPCKDTCPTHQDVPGYLYHAQMGQYKKALSVILQTNPFPSVTGMICDHTCQLKCTRINYDESLHIRDIKRFLAEHASMEKEHLQPSESFKKIAIIGAGPAGLSCAWYLRKAGLEVDIYEARKMTGGMVSAAIPGFRLTDTAIESDIQQILDSGVILHDNFLVTKENYPVILSEHDAVFLSVGAQLSTPLLIEGINAPGVLDVLEFLYATRQGIPTAVGKHVLIIGGGNTAMDAARTAYRLVGDDGSVTVAYRRTISEMPADKGEIRAVLDEGIRIIELTGPEKVLTLDGKIKSLLCSRNILAMKGSDGRAIPVKVPGSEFEIPCDTVIPAIGQALAIDFIDIESVATKPGEYRTGIEKLYVGGDALRGASTAINAIADGRFAALEIMNDLGIPGKIMIPLQQKGVQLADLLHRKSVREYGIKPFETALKNRKNFDLVMETFKEEEARKEASRCLHCDMICNVCTSVCPNLANFGYSIEPVHYKLEKAVRKDDGSIHLMEDSVFEVEQQFQILNIHDLCNECGNCVTFCPSSGRPFADKPGLCLSVDTFNQEHEAYFLSRLHDRDVLIYKHNESIRTLSYSESGYVYETDQVRAEMDAESFRIRKVEFLTSCVKECRFSLAAEMSIIMKGALQLIS